MEDRVSCSKPLDKAAFELIKFCKVEAGQLCGRYTGISFYHFLTSKEPYCFTKLIFHGCPMMTRLFIPHLYLTHLHIMAPLVLPLNPSFFMIMRRFMKPLGPFRRSKPPYEPMFNMRMPLFVTLFKSKLMSFMG